MLRLSSLSRKEEEETRRTNRTWRSTTRDSNAESARETRVLSRESDAEDNTIGKKKSLKKVQYPGKTKTERTKGEEEAGQREGGAAMRKTTTTGASGCVGDRRDKGQRQHQHRQEKK